MSSDQVEPKRYLLKKVNEGEVPICAFFTRPEGCRNGDTCKFRHVREGEQETTSAPSKTPSSSSSSSRPQGSSLFIQPSNGTSKQKRQEREEPAEPAAKKKQRLSVTQSSSQSRGSDTDSLSSLSDEEGSSPSKKQTPSKVLFVNSKIQRKKKEEKKMEEQKEEKKEEEKKEETKTQEQQQETKTSEEKQQWMREEEERLARERLEDGTLNQIVGREVVLAELCSWMRTQKAFNARYTFETDANWIDTTEHFQQLGKLGAKRRGKQKTYAYLAVDCEMCETMDPVTGLKQDEVIRVSCVDVDHGSGEALLDVFVKPENEITDMRTRIHRIRKEQVEAASSLRFAQAKLLSLMREDTVLVGHSLDNDLKVMKIVHPHLLDTAVLFGVRSTQPRRRGAEEEGGEEGGEEEEVEEVINSPGVIDLAALLLPEHQSQALLQQYVEARRNAGRKRDDHTFGGEPEESAKSAYSLHDPITDAKLSLMGALHVVRLLQRKAGAGEPVDLGEALPVLINRAPLPSRESLASPKASGSGPGSFDRSRSQLLMHRLDTAVTADMVKEWVARRTSIVPTDVTEVTSKGGTRDGRCVISFLGAAHASLAFDSVPTEIRQDKKGFSQKRFLLEGGGYALIRKMRKVKGSS